MRLTPQEVMWIRIEILLVDPEAEVWLFGSRVDDSKHGGDIDLLVASDHIDFSKKLDALVNIKSRIGDQKIDLHVVTKANVVSDPFVRSIMPHAIRL